MKAKGHDSVWKNEDLPGNRMKLAFFKHRYLIKWLWGSVIPVSSTTKAASLLNILMP